MMEKLCCSIVGHLVGDYLFQNDWMALNKKKSSFHCLIHCVLWTASVCAFGELGFTAACVLFVTHFIQDRTGVINWYMNMVGQQQFKAGPCAPWSMIVVDNVWHILTIWAVVRFIP